MIDQNISSEMFERLVSIYKPNYIFLDKKKKILNQKFSSIYSFKNYDLLERKSKFFSKLNDDLMLLISTSGSTGSSKFVRQSYDNVQSNTYSISKYLSISE